MGKVRFFSFFFFLLALLSCGGNDAPQVPLNKLPADPTDQNLEDFNKGYVEFEEKEINHYIDSLHLKMLKSPLGFRYQILSPGSKPLVAKGNTVSVIYSISLLNGKSFPQLTNQANTFVVGSGNALQGIDLAVRLLGAGGSVSLIIPALQAYGVSGFEDCVPSWTPIRCQLKVTKISKK